MQIRKLHTLWRRKLDRFFVSLKVIINVAFLVNLTGKLFSNLLWTTLLLKQYIRRPDVPRN